MKELLKKVTEGQNLTREEAAKAMDMMLEGTASPVLVSAFLTALRMKGETVDEIVGCTEMMKSKGGSVKLDTDEYIDFVGTGGDGANSFNISTTSMFVCAAAVPLTVQNQFVNLQQEHLKKKLHLSLFLQLPVQAVKLQVLPLYLIRQMI